MSRRLVLATAVSLALTGSLVAGPAYAEGEFTITVVPASGHPTETFDVTGDAVDPVCPNDGVAVSLLYTKADGSIATTTANTTTDAAGHFTAQLAVPENAYAGEFAQVSAVIADCAPPDTTPFARSSISVDFDVLAYDGAFSISDTTGEPGDTITFEGTNCWGGSIVVFFGDDEEIEVDLGNDRTFSGSYVLPDAPGGVYEFGAECPGTDYEVLAFTLVNPEAPPAAPPARPVPRTPTFTG